MWGKNDLLLIGVYCVWFFCVFFCCYCMCVVLGTKPGPQPIQGMNFPTEPVFCPILVYLLVVFVVPGIRHRASKLYSIAFSLYHILKFKLFVCLFVYQLFFFFSGAWVKGGPGELIGKAVLALHAGSLTPESLLSIEPGIVPA